MPRGSQRDPLSVAYDDHVRVVIAAIMLRKRFGRDGVPVQVTVPVPAVDELDDVPGSNWTRHQRAWVRSLYYQLKRTKPNRVISKPVWGARNPATGRQLVEFRVWTRAPSDYADRLAQDSYVHNPSLRSKTALPGAS